MSSEDLDIASVRIVEEISRRAHMRRYSEGGVDARCPGVVERVNRKTPIENSLAFSAARRESLSFHAKAPRTLKFFTQRAQRALSPFFPASNFEDFLL
jgi:hypothetical protein